jgi:tRNA A-37 threonylcarbamoyl transferase component Bud32
MSNPIPATADAVDPLLGTTLGSFRLVKRIGQGGMGTVYLGEQTLIGSRVAVKVLHEHLASDPSLVARFYAEARAVNLIVHPNIVNIFDMNVVPPRRFYLVMEYLEGQSLSAAAPGRMSAEVALPLLIQVCHALSAAHRHGVLHRDLKPENVFLCRREGPVPFVKILDFGIAKLFGGDLQEGQTTAGFIVGTPEYMAPEQATGETLDGRADLYALGVIAYRLATGRLPFSGGGLTGVLLAHRDQPPKPPQELVPDIPQGWSNAILRALAKRPEHRFQSADEFRLALEATLASLGGVPPEAPPVAASLPEPKTPAVQAVPATASRTPPAAAAPASFAGTVVFPGSTPRAIPMRDLSRGGLFICMEGAPPAPFSRLRLSLQAPAGEMVDAEVVRQVTAEQASGWGMLPGVAVQFVSPSRAFKEALARRMEGHAPSAPAAAERLDTLGEKALVAWRGKVQQNPYALLGCAQDADFADIRTRIRVLRTELEPLKERALAPSQQRELEGLLARLHEAGDAISTPARRADTDADLGNWRGVARCIAAGLTVTELDSRRERFLKAHPGADAKAHVHRVVGKAWEVKSATPQAVEEYERGLQIDPLNLGLHQAYSALKRRVVSPEGTRA